MLAYAFRTGIADEYFQHFKWDVIAGLDAERDGTSWQLTSAEFRRWLATNQRHEEQHDRSTNT
jgi:hypothetical protein